MSDMDDIRELLERRAGEVPAHREVPRAMLRRARRRVAAALVVALGVAAVLSFGGYAGVRALSSLDRSVPVQSPTAPPPRGVAVACPADVVKGRLDLQGAAGSRVGSFTFTNVSTDLTCTLRGRPALSLLSDGTATIRATQPWWKVNAMPRPTDWPTVTLRPGGKAVVRVRWSNWCSGLPVSLVARLPAGGGDISLGSPADVPPCLGPGPSTIELGPFEPGADATP